MTSVSKKRKLDNADVSTDNIPTKKQRLNDENNHNKNDIESKHDDECKESIAKNLKQAKLKDDIRSKLPTIVTDLYDYKCKYHINPKEGGSVTFYPSLHLLQKEYGAKVFPKEKFIESTQLTHFLQKLGCSSIESVHDWDAEIIKKKDSFHGFVRAMEIAYFEHYPLRIKVSHIWLLILHALAAHIDLNAEQLRSKYVKHEGKKQLIVTREEFVKGSRNNDWASVINEFAEQIDKNTVDNIANIVENNFSSTTDLEKIASKVSLMAICKHYFSYMARGGCGFHQITLDGNKNDWINLKKKVELLFEDKVNKQWADKWKKPLFDILDRFIDVYDGEIDCLFWNSMVRRGKPGSGMLIPVDTVEELSMINTYYSGWINIFFPYLNQKKMLAWGNYNEGTSNDLSGNESSFQENYASFAKYSIDQYKKYADFYNNPLNGTYFESSSLKVFPIGLANAPVLYKQLNTGKSYDLKFAAGFIGVQQNEKTLEVCPKIGWFIAEK